MSKEELFAKIKDAVIEMDDETVESLCNEAIAENFDATEVIREGLIKGMDRVGELYATGEYFLPEVLTASFALNAGVDILKPYMKKEVSTKHVRIVIGVVEGDTHDIGKNLVKIMCESAGFEVIDLGRDVPINEFVDVAEKENADFILMSTLMTTTMSGMKAVVDELTARGIRDKYKVMIGGGPISQKFCDEIGADAYTVDAASCVKKIKEIMGI
ncbi:MAG: corrinoid protein [Lachnospiraceae bacterium]|nr:corrinoid protein [Lachnospiraceae bacterium]MBQ9579667.1 corrinoid protein [Lachnospiraceae bacterium]MBR0434451.1 corrinoid protein [Lachnospiraceae bacterium]